MTWAHFEQALEHAVCFYRQETQFELNLAGIGESTLHPMFAQMIRAARKAMPAIRLCFATNGLNFSLLHSLGGGEKKPAERERMQSVIEALKDAKKQGPIELWVSLHRPEKGSLAVEVLQEAGLNPGVSVDPSINSDDWAGQVKWKRSYQHRLVCQWLRDGKVMVMADGRVTSCCLDASGVGVIGHVEQSVSAWGPHGPYSLCKTCQQTLPEGMSL